MAGWIVSILQLLGRGNCVVEVVVVVVVVERLDTVDSFSIVFPSLLLLLLLFFLLSSFAC